MTCEIHKIEETRQAHTLILTLKVLQYYSVTKHTSKKELQNTTVHQLQYTLIIMCNEYISLSAFTFIERYL
jgi:hypothetical protein